VGQFARQLLSAECLADLDSGMKASGVTGFPISQLALDSLLQM
jgi:hypothetical protein